MRIKVIKSNPRDGQLGIESLIGREFDVVKIDGRCVDKDNGSVAVVCEDSPFNGQIVLNKTEFTLA